MPKRQSKTKGQAAVAVKRLVSLPFDDPALVAKYGSWMRVQVAFYDYIFRIGTELCAKHWKELALKEVADQFADGGDLYERSAKGIMYKFKTAQSAWASFVEANGDISDGKKP
jgi:hypothetical protein